MVGFDSCSTDDSIAKLPRGDARYGRLLWAPRSRSFVSMILQEIGGMEVRCYYGRRVHGQLKLKDTVYGFAFRDRS